MNEKLKSFLIKFAIDCIIIAIFGIIFNIFIFGFLILYILIFKK
jgi:hypothetical protein